MAARSAFEDLYETALPPVGGKPPEGAMPTSMFGCIWQATGRQQIRLAVLTCLVFPLSMVPLELQRRIVNNVVAEGNTSLLFVMCGIYLGVVLVHGGLKYTLNVYQGRVAEGVIRSLRKRITTEAEKGESRRNGREEGTMVAVAAAEAEKLGGFVGESISFPLLRGGILVSIFGYMLWVEPLIAAISGLLFVPALIVTPYVQNMINRHVETRTELVREFGDEMTNGGTAGRSDEEYAERSERLVEDAYCARLRIFRLKYFLKFLNNLFGHLGSLSVLLVGGLMVIRGQTEVGTIVAFVSGVERLTDPSRELLNYYRRLSQMRVQYRLVTEAF